MLRNNYDYLDLICAEFIKYDLKNKKLGSYLINKPRNYNDSSQRFHDLHGEYPMSELYVSLMNPI